MDKHHEGAEFNQLSRILFDKAVMLWQASVGLELGAGIISIIVSVSQTSIKTSTAWAIVVTAVLVLAFLCRSRFGSIYDAAETMRRQSILREGLNWPIGRTQFNEWKSRAGREVLRKFSLSQRPSDLL